MSYITLKCKNCGANMSLNTESHSATCNHCGSTFLIADLLDEKDALFVEKFNPQNLEEKMMAQESLRQGETYLFQAKYEQAETSFKRAIDLDEDNFKGYLGVVKAKTNNLNIIPENDDYVQYVNYALDLAKGDDYTFVKNELAKLKLLKREQSRQKKIRQAKEKQDELKKRQQQGFSKIKTTLVVSLTIIFAILILLSSKFVINIFTKKTTAKTVNIGTVEQFEKVFSNKKYLNYNINLNCDIDLENSEISPFGTYKNAFTGTFNGNKHSISNAIIKTSSDEELINYIGLFGYAKFATISNLVFDNVSISTSNENYDSLSTYIGLLAGKAEATTITNIEIKNTCMINANTNFDFTLSLGGLVGASVNSSYIAQVSSHPQIEINSLQSSISSNSYIGSIAGLINDSVIEKTCSNSTINSTLTNETSTQASVYIGGIIGYIQNITQKVLNNIKGNLFSGSINANASGFNCKISAIAGCGLKATSKLNNKCLITQNSFVLEGANLLETNLYDFDSSDKFVEFFSSSERIFESLNSTFGGWKNTNSYEPTLN